MFLPFPIAYHVEPSLTIFRDSVFGGVFELHDRKSLVYRQTFRYHRYFSTGTM